MNMEQVGVDDGVDGGHDGAEADL